MPEKDRRSLQLPAELVEDVGGIAKRRGHVLSNLITTAIASATKAAERGDLDTIPDRLPPFIGRAGETKILKYMASTEEATRSVAAR